MEYLPPTAHRQSVQEISYLEYNPQAAKTIVLLHGLGATSESWVFQTPVLVEDGFRVLCPDIPGFGQSSWKGKTWSVSNVTTVLEEWLQIVAPHGYHLGGISMGGTFALQLTLEFPGMIRSLVLVSTFARLPVGNPAQWPYYIKRYYLIIRYGLKAQAELVANRLFPAGDQALLRQAFIEQILKSDDKTYTQALRALGLFNVERRIGQIHKPVLVISGENDTTIPLSAQKVLAAKIPGARYVIIPDAGHAVTVDQASQFNQALLDFLTAS